MIQIGIFNLFHENYSELVQASVSLKFFYGHQTSRLIKITKSMKTWDHEMKYQETW